MQTAVTDNESGLIDRAQCGDREAFGELIHLHRAGVVNVVYRMSGDSALAEDAAQEAFIKAWQHLRGWQLLPGYQPRSAFRSWLYRIAVNTALDLLRREKPAADIETIEWVSGPARVEASLEHRQRLEAVRRAVLRLPEASRAVLVLREYEGLSYEEIAAALDIPPGTVMSRLSSARKRLLAELNPVLEEV